MRKSISSLDNMRDRQSPATAQGCYWKYGMVSSHHIIVPVLVDAPWKDTQSRDGGSWSITMEWAVECGSFKHVCGVDRIFASSPIQGECKAILCGLQEGLKCETNIIIKTDCKNTMDSIRNPGASPPDIKHIVREIHSIANLASFVLILKVSRSSVRQAHMITHRVRTGAFIILFIYLFLQFCRILQSYDPILSPYQSKVESQP